jgi:hypothetical protein
MFFLISFRTLLVEISATFLMALSYLIVKGYIIFQLYVIKYIDYHIEKIFQIRVTDFGTCILCHVPILILRADLRKSNLDTIFM